MQFNKAGVKSTCFAELKWSNTNVRFLMLTRNQLRLYTFDTSTRRYAVLLLPSMWRSHLRLYLCGDRELYASVQL